MKSQLRDAVYGAAVGDALGVPYEFLSRGSFDCTDMTGFGTHHQPAGTWSDDTALMLATCDSIRAKRGRIDIDDMRTRFVKWMRQGAYTPDGEVFDIGNATATALYEGRGCAGERSNGNGSLMRIAPLAYTNATDNQVRQVSAITHAHRISIESCVCFVNLLRDLIAGKPFEQALVDCQSADKDLPVLADIPGKSEDQISSGGYVVHTLEAAIWCFANTDNYADCVLKAVNLGRDTDTTACVAGALAGAVYGKDAIPAAWVEALRGKEVLEATLF